MIKSIFEAITEWFSWNWPSLFFWIVLLIVIGCGIMIGKGVVNMPPRVEVTKTLAVGKLTSIRATGDFGIYNTELKFEDGSMLVVTYSFSRNHNLKIGMEYKIWDSSFYGYQCKLLKE